jgi:hypothetical protein
MNWYANKEPQPPAHYADPSCGSGHVAPTAQDHEEVKSWNIAKPVRKEAPGYGW